MMEELNFQSRVENVDNQKVYRQILDNQEKIKIKQPERQFKPYESPERVSSFKGQIRKSPPRIPHKVGFVDNTVEADYQLKNHTMANKDGMMSYPRTNPITAPLNDPLSNPYI